MNSKRELNSVYESAEQVELAFYEAFGSGDFVLMESLHAKHGVSFSHPNSSTIVGRQNVIDNWEFVLKDIPKVLINTEILSIAKSQDIEVHQVLESFVVNELTGQKSEVFTTNVYVLQENGWRLQMQHASLAEVKISTSELILNESKVISLQTSSAIN